MEKWSVTTSEHGYWAEFGAKYNVEYEEEMWGELYEEEILERSEGETIEKYWENHGDKEIEGKYGKKY